MLAGVDAQTDVSGEDEGTDVQRGTVDVGDPVLVHFHQSLDGLDEILDGNLGDAQTVGGILHPLGVAVRTEQLDGVVRGAIGLHALENLLGVVEHHRGGVQGEGGIGDDAGVVPALALGIVHHEHMVGEDFAKAQLVFVGGFRLGGSGLGNLDIQHDNTLP